MTTHALLLVQGDWSPKFEQSIGTRNAAFLQLLHRVPRFLRTAEIDRRLDEEQLPVAGAVSMNRRGTQADQMLAK